MKTFATAILIALGLLATAGCQTDPKSSANAAGSASASANGTGGADSFFRDELSRSGEWVDLPDLGACWYPTNVAPGWRPYTQGRWVWTDGVGWLWVGSERWSWATDHYGRWAFVDSHGWIWVPGRQWSPAWVAMRSGNDYIGWAPLPPPDNGVAELDVSRLQSRDIFPAAWHFVPDKSFLDPKLPECLEPVTRNVTLLDLTQDMTRYEVVDDRLINRGVPLEQIEGARGGAVEHYVVVENDRPRLSEIHGKDVTVYRPAVTLIDMPAAVVMASTKQQAKPLDNESMAWQRQRLDEYHRQLREQMDARHEQELASMSAGMTRGELDLHQAREIQAFEDERQREVEALRRLQLNQRERDAQQRAAQAAAPAASNGAANGPPPKYELPPEWQLPPEMMNPPISPKSANPPGSGK